MPTKQKVYPWKRYWCPIGKPIHNGDQGKGFLTDPEDPLGRYFNPDLKALEDIPDSPVRVFCGEPAIGKTTCLRAYLNRLQPTDVSGQVKNAFLHIEFRSVPDLETFKYRTFRSPTWQEWQEGTHPLTLLVDGLDEGMVRIDRFLPFLTQELREIPKQRFQLILVCRTMEWQCAWKQGEDLLALFSQPDSQTGDCEGGSPWIYKLCPLRREDVVLAAKAQRVDPEAFLKAVDEREAASLASRPYTLRMLLAEFIQKRTLGSSRRELYEAYAERLCDEPDSERLALLRRVYPSGSLPAKEKVHRVASQIAALLMLTGKNALYLGPPEDATSTDLVIGEVSAPVGYLSEEHFPDERTVHDVLATALFTDRGKDRLFFDHLTMAECLATRHMEKMPLIQLKELFCKQDSAGEYVHPQLAAAAAWLAEKRDDFFAHVFDVDPEILLRSETAQLSSENRRQLVDKLLGMAARDVLFDRKRLYYSGLRHSALADHLSPWIRDKSKNLVVRRMALEIATECQVTALFDDILDLTSDPKEIKIFESSLGSALEALASKEDVPKILRFAKNEVVEDENDQLKAMALKILLKFGASVKDVVEYLAPPRNSHYFGEYRHTLKYDIPRHIKDSDVVPVLEAVLTWKGDWGSTSSRGGLVHVVLEKGLHRLDDPRIRELIVRLWVLASHNHTHPCLGTKECSVSTLLKSQPVLRRRLAECLLNSNHCPSGEIWRWVGYTDGALLRSEDFPWLLERISKVPPECVKNWAKAIGAVWDTDRCFESLDLLLEKRQEIDALGKEFEWLRPWDLEEPLAQKAKAYWLQNKQWERPSEKPVMNGPSARERIVQWLMGAKLSDPEACGRIFQTILSPENGEMTMASISLDIESASLWQGLAPDDQAKIRSIAQQFLITHDENGRAPSNSITPHVQTGLRALYLLRKTILSDENLKRAVSQQWIPVLVCGWGANGIQHSDLAKLACKLNLPRVKECLRAEIVEGAKQGNVPLHTLHVFRACWVSELADLLFELVSTDALPDAARSTLAEFAVEADPNLALRCFDWARLPDSQGEKVRQDVAAAVMSGFLFVAPGKHWDTLWPLIASEPVVTEKAMLRLAQTHHHDRERLDTRQLTPPQIGNLYRRLHALFSPETDPQIPDKVYTPTPRMEVRELRDALPTVLAARGTEEACAVLHALADEFPSQRLGLLWRHHEAMEARRQSAWVPFSPREVNLFLVKSSLRKVVSSGEFLDVVLESLGRLQRRINATPNPLVEQFWRISRDGSRRGKFSPQYEEDISNRIAAWLQDDLGRDHPVVIGREVQPVWSQKTDIQVTALSTGDPTKDAPLRVVIEVKGCWNTGVKTDCKAQLVDRYLALDRKAAGLYLVGWFVSDRWDDSSDSRCKRQNALAGTTCEDVCKEVDGLAAEAAGGNSNVRGLVMDFRLPA